MPDPTEKPSGQSPLRVSRWKVTLIQPDPTQPRREFDETALAELTGNLRELGQLCPVIGTTDPADPTRLNLVDGERRLHAARRIPLEAIDAVVLPARPSPTQLRLVQISLNQFREQLSPGEQCAAYANLIAELNISQAELAVRLGVSPSKISKALARDRLLPECRDLADKVEATVVPLIAKLRPEPQREAMAFATTPTEAGRLPTRDQVAAYIQATTARRPAARPKALAGSWDHRSLRIGLKPEDTHDRLVEALRALIAFVQKNRNVPLANLGLLMPR